MKKIILIFTVVLGGLFTAQAQTELEGVFFQVNGVDHGIYSPSDLDRCYGSLGTEGTDFSVVVYTLAADGSTISIGSGSPVPIPAALQANYISTFAQASRIIRFTNSSNQTIGGVPAITEAN